MHPKFILRFSEKYLVIMKINTIFVPKNIEYENNIQKYIG